MPAETDSTLLHGRLQEKIGEGGSDLPTRIDVVTNWLATLRKPVP